MAKGPVLIELDEDAPEVAVAEAPAVPDAQPAAPEGQAMRSAAALAARPPSRLLRWVLGLGAALLGALMSVAAWDFVTALLERNSILGWAVTGLFAAFIAALLLLIGAGVWAVVGLRGRKN